MWILLTTVLLDISKGDGLRVLRALRGIERNLPVVVLSSDAPPGVVVEAMRAGASDFLTKPISPEALQRALGNIFADPGLDESDTQSTELALNEAYLGFSPNMRAIHKLLPQVAWSESPGADPGRDGRRQRGAGQAVARAFATHA